MLACEIEIQIESQQGQMNQTCISKQDQHWFRWWLVACSAPSHYLDYCWPIVNWTPPWAQNYVNSKSEYNNLHEPTDNLEYNHNEPKEDKTMSIF